MSYDAHSVENLGSPFLSASESIFVIPKNGVVNLHRSRFKLLFILDGEIEHEIDGLGRRPLRTGDILIVPKPVKHVYINTHPTRAIPLQSMRLFLDMHHLQGRVKKRVRKPESDLSDYILHHLGQVAQITGGIDNEIHQILSRFRHETERRAIGFRHRVYSLCVELVISAARKLQKAPVDDAARPESQKGRLVTAAREYIFKHLANDITLGEIAWHTGRSEEHLARVFKRETGETVFDCVRGMRIDKAKTYLLEPGMSLTEIATRCGFNSLSFFSKTFKQYARMAPSDYRKQIETTLQLPGANADFFPVKKTKPASRFPRVPQSMFH